MLRLRKSLLISTALCLILMIFSPALAQEQEKKTVAAVSVEKGGALLGQGRLVLEPSFQYAQTSAKQVVSISGYTIFDVIHIGKIDVNELRRQIYMPSLTARLGFRKMEINLKAPWLYRRDRETKTAGSSTNVVSRKSGGFGDMEGGLVYRLMEERASRPDIMLNFGFKSRTGRNPYGLADSEFPTGNGHLGYSGGLIFVKTSDPVVLYLNITYFYNARRTIGRINGIDYGRIDPGDSLEYNLGTVVALNEKFSLNFGLSHRLTGYTYQNGVKISGSDLNAISFTIGSTYAISRTFSIDFVAGIGLTGDANDVTLQIRVPFSFII